MHTHLLVFFFPCSEVERSLRFFSRCLTFSFSFLYYLVDSLTRGRTNLPNTDIDSQGWAPHPFFLSLLDPHLFFFGSRVLRPTLFALFPLDSSAFFDCLPLFFFFSLGRPATRESRGFLPLAVQRFWFLFFSFLFMTFLFSSEVGLVGGAFLLPVPFFDPSL